MGSGAIAPYIHTPVTAQISTALFSQNYYSAHVEFNDSCMTVLYRLLKVIVRG